MERANGSARLGRILNAIYFDSKNVGSYGGVDRLRRAARVPSYDAKNWLVEEDAYTLHKPVRRRFKRRRVIVGGMNQQWQADLVDVTRLKKYNDGTTFLLTVIDVFFEEGVVYTSEEQIGSVSREGLPPIVDWCGQTDCTADGQR